MGHLENAGSRKTRALETASLAKLASWTATTNEMNVFEFNEPRVRWMYSSCLTHTFLVPARELLFLGCLYGDYSNQAAGVVCNDNGAAMEYRIEGSEVFLRVWKTTASWVQAEFDQQTLRQIINSFVRLEEDDHEGFTPRHQFSEQVMDVYVDCDGPNCLPLEEPVDAIPSCQAFIELRTRFKAVPLRPQLIWAVVVLPLLVYLIVRACVFRDLEKQYHEASKIIATRSTQVGERRARFQGGQRTSSDTKSTRCLLLRGITVRSGDRKRTILVDNVDFELHFGALTALTGRSGAGKSTLLRSLSQKKLGLDVTITDGQESLATLKKAYLRQGDNLAWSNTRPCDLLLMNGKIYGARDETTYEMYRLLEKLFHRGGESSFNPFFHTRIGDLSGGQRRLVSIASTLLLEASVLLLDEPLSGL